MGRFVSGDNVIDAGAANNVVTFADVLNKPSTLDGYGIVDAARANNITFGSLVNRPTTLLGYGITDAMAKGGQIGLPQYPNGLPPYVPGVAGLPEYPNGLPTYEAGASISFNSIIDKPTTLAGYGIIDAGSASSMPFSSITNKPTTLSGYGINDAVTTAQLNTAISTVSGSGGTVNLSFDSITNKPTTLSGYGIIDAVTTTQLNTAVASGGTISNNFVKKSGGDTLTGDYIVNGNITATGDVTAYSDERLKKDWVDLPVGFIESLSNIKHGNYTRIDTGQQQVGVSAQELQGLLPNAVLTDDNSMLSVAYGNAALVAAIELAKEIVSLKKIIADLVVIVNEKNGL